MNSNICNRAVLAPQASTSPLQSNNTAVFVHCAAFHHVVQNFALRFLMAKLPRTPSAVPQENTCQQRPSGSRYTVGSTCVSAARVASFRAVATQFVKPAQLVFLMVQHNGADVSRPVLASLLWIVLPLATPEPQLVPCQAGGGGASGGSLVSSCAAGIQCDCPILTVVRPSAHFKQKGEPSAFANAPLAHILQLPAPCSG